MILSKKKQFSSTDTLPFIRVNEEEVEVKLQSLDIDVKVNGLYAETTQKMVFYNPNYIDLEGELQFPMLDGGLVCGYALDIDGKMRDGVIVSKQKARMVLETEIRKGIDPGLIEQVMGNIYRTRVYPIPAKGSRQVNITYTSDLTVNNNSASYHLPLKHASEIDQVKLKIEVMRSDIKPEISGGNGNLSLIGWKDKWVSEAVLKKGAMLDDLRIEMPDLPEQFMMTEETDENEVFFCVSNSYEGLKESKSLKPENVSIIWDASGSRNNIGKDIEFIKELLGKWSKLSIDLIVFRNKLDPKTKTFNILNGKSDELIKYLEQIPYDGGTDLSLLDIDNQKGVLCLLFSDGLGTIKSDLPSQSKKRVFTISSSANSNTALLKNIGQQSGGGFINLQRLSIPDGINIICDNSKNIQITKSEGCDDLFISPGQKRFTIIGKLSKETANIALSGLSEDKSIKISKNNSPKGNVLSKVWAGSEVEKLSISENENKEKILSIGMQYGIVTSGSSLIVLETLEQYLEHGIQPPDSLPELRQKYRENISENENNKKKEKDIHINHIAELWKERLEWWKKEYPKTIEKKKLAVNRISELNPMIDERPNELQYCMTSIDTMDLADEDDVVLGSEPSVRASERMRMSRDEYACESIQIGDRAEKPISAKGMASVIIDEWDPDTEYLNKIKKVSNEKKYDTYLIERKNHYNSPSFFLDCGDYFLKQGLKDYAIRILTNLLEMGLDDVSLKRMFAWRMQQAGELDTAIKTFRNIKDDRDDEPQSYRDLALALEERWQKNKNETDINEAMSLFYKVIEKEWERFPEIEIIALMELNRVIYLAKKADITIPEFIDKRLIKHLDLDIRIAMSWDADLTDVDLHVFEPTGEHAYYDHNRTIIGGLVSKDFTQGYGPEEYLLRKAAPGTYKIKAHYYGSHQQKLFGGCTVIVTLFTNYGRENEVKKTLTLRLDKPGDDLIIGEVKIEGELEEKEKEDLFRKLKVDMSVDEVTGIIGQPDEIKGSGDKEIEMIYKKDNRNIHILFNPKLVSVKEKMEGAKLDLL